jgi:hypothetical protein
MWKDKEGEVDRLNKESSVMITPKSQWWFNNEFGTVIDINKRGWIVRRNDGSEKSILPEDIKFWVN